MQGLLKILVVVVVVVVVVVIVFACEPPFPVTNITHEFHISFIQTQK